MKKTSLLILGLFLSAITLAQAPNKMSFQTVVRNSQGKLVLNKSIGVRISILQSTSTGTAVYVETHTKSSNANGLLTLEVGSGSVATGTFSMIDWSQGPYFLQTEMDVYGSTNYTISGVTEFVSVPYAMNSKNADNANSVKTLSNGSNVGDMCYWNGTTWVPLNKGTQRQSLTFCDGKPAWTLGGVCPGTISTLNCATATNNGTLFATTAASVVTSVVPYTGGNGGTHNGQVVSSTGITGLTATLQAGNFTNGAGSLTFTINGTPVTSGTASFALNIGGKTCTLTRNVLGVISTLNCSSATNNGTLTATTAASGVTSVISYAGGNGGTHTGQVVSSTGVTGLIATLQAGNFANGAGSLTYTITGTPSTKGTASFAMNIGGQMCALTRTVIQPTSGYGSNISDVEGNSYKTVYIGTQQWMAENLKTAKYSDGTFIPYITDNSQWVSQTEGDAGGWCYYNNDAANNAKYGKLYNWYVVDGWNKKKVCPTGWHVPIRTEWAVLSDYLGGDDVAGGKMKEVGTTSWVSPNTSATNTSLFTALPGGYRDYTGSYGWIGYDGSWWSSSQMEQYKGDYHYLNASSGALAIYSDDIRAGFSVRCLRD
jgi:uncharacterized protein (TIGR02145 family)